MTTWASAPGRVCLAGEDLDWMGGHSVQLAVDLRTVAEARLRRTRRTHSPTSERVRVQDAGGLDTRYPLAALTRVEAETGPLEGTLRLTSALPPASGLASSAAVLVATLAATAAEMGLDWPELRIAEVAFEAELDLTGGCVGPMDPVACVRGGITCMAVENGEWKLTADRARVPPGALLLASTGGEHATGSSIRRKKERWRRRDEDIVTYQAVADAAAVEMTERLRDLPLDGAQIGALVSRCHHALAHHLGVSPDDLNDLVRTAERNGAWGAKLCGSGEGGTIVALVPEQRAVGVEESLTEAGATVTAAAVAEHGLVVTRVPPHSSV